MQINLSKKIGSKAGGVVVKSLRQGFDQLRTSKDLDYIPIIPRIGVEFKVALMIKINEIETFYTALAEFMKKWQ